MDIRIANREDPVIRLLQKKQPYLGLPCLSRLFWQATTSVQNFRTFTIVYMTMHRFR